VGSRLAAADALLVHLKADPLFAITIPSKTQAYMAAGKPIIMGVEGDAADLVRDSGCGLVIPPQNAEALAAAVENLLKLSRGELERLGKNGYEFYRRELSFELGVQAIIRVLKDAVA